MNDLFLGILDSSIVATYTIIIILVARFFLKKAPKVFSYMLWSVVFFRLLCPINVESGFSILPVSKVAEEVSLQMEQLVESPIGEQGVGQSGMSPQEVTEHPENVQGNHVTLPPVAHNFNGANPPYVTNSIKTGNTITMVDIFVGVWLLGMGAVLLYSAISLVKLKKTLVGAVGYEHNIYLADYLDSPLVLGIIKPKIYIPSTLSQREFEYIVIHEQAHIQRFDHIVKIIFFLILTLHWFNPFVWIAYFALGNDMEMSIDESVLKKMDRDIRREYSNSLLSLATGSKVSIPLAFGEGNTKERILNVMNYKKTKIWVGIVALLTVITVILCTATNPVEDAPQTLATPTIEESETVVVPVVEKVIVSEEDKIMEQWNTLGASGTDFKEMVGLIDDKISLVSKENATQMVRDLEALQEDHLGYFEHLLQENNLYVELTGLYAEQYDIQAVYQAKNQHIQDFITEMNGTGYVFQEQRGYLFLIPDYTFFEKYIPYVSQELASYIDNMIVLSSQYTADDASLAIGICDKLCYFMGEDMQLSNTDLSLEDLKGFNAELHRNFTYVESGSQSLIYEGFYSGEAKFAQGASRKGPMPTVNEERQDPETGNTLVYTKLQGAFIGKELYGIYENDIEEGRNFTEEDFVVDDPNQEISVILGSEYKGVYEIDDILTLSIHEKNLKFKVIGFFKEGTNLPQDFDSVDLKIAIPSYDITYDPIDDNDASYQKYYYRQKNQGFIKVTESSAQMRHRDYVDQVEEVASKYGKYYTLFVSHLCPKS